ncbi:hypothetical protein X801_08568 [Opisthorchis viverrini]|uniref:Uncharacterized protein n=1 Tax=Opisthorchis viverrini TaxID=6198 RepID=A0A1S8WMM9_OPIVI|nr:hypothetical protein X801_08568 [Opisthorchis viverrini]
MRSYTSTISPCTHNPADRLLYVEGKTSEAEDRKVLNSLADDMLICSITLEKLQYPSDLNSCRTIGVIVTRLPSNMQIEWLNLAAKSVKFRPDKTFDELANLTSDNAGAEASQQM